MTDLLPCPFCGESGAVLDNEDKEWEANTWWVQCENCEAHGPHQFNGDSRHIGFCSEVTKTDEECIEAARVAWNGRVL